MPSHSLEQEWLHHESQQKINILSVLSAIWKQESQLKPLDKQPTHMGSDTAHYIATTANVKSWK